MQNQSWVPKVLKPLLAIAVLIIIGLSIYTYFPGFISKNKSNNFVPPVITTALVGSTTAELIEINKFAEGTHSYVNPFQDGIMDRNLIEAVWHKSLDNKLGYTDTLLNCAQKKPSENLEDLSKIQKIRDDIWASGFDIVSESELYLNNDYAQNKHISKDFLIRPKGSVIDRVDFLGRQGKLKKSTNSEYLEFECLKEYHDKENIVQTMYSLYEKKAGEIPSVLYYGQDNKSLYSFNTVEGAKLLAGEDLIDERGYINYVKKGSTILLTTKDTAGFLKAPQTFEPLFNLKDLPEKSDFGQIHFIDEDNAILRITKGGESWWDNTTQFIKINRNTKQAQTIFEEKGDFVISEGRDINDNLIINAVAPKDCASTPKYVLDKDTFKKSNALNLFDIWGPNQDIGSPNLKYIAHVREHPQGLPIPDMCSGGNNPGILKVEVRGVSDKILENSPNFMITPYGWTSDSKYFIYIVRAGSFDSDWKNRGYVAYSPLTGEKIEKLDLEKLVEELNIREKTDKYELFKVYQTASSYTEMNNETGLTKDNEKTTSYPNMDKDTYPQGMINVKDILDSFWDTEYLPINN